MNGEPFRFSNFWMNLLSPRLESFGYPSSIGEDFVILASVILTQCQRVTDRRTDIQTNNSTTVNTGLYIASYDDIL